MLSSLSRGLLLADVRARLVLALAAIGVLWAVVLWASVEPPPGTSDHLLHAESVSVAT